MPRPKKAVTPDGYTFKQLNVGDLVALESIKSEAKPKAETPRQKAIRERDEDIQHAFNIAATAPASLAVPIHLKAGQKIATLRLAVQKIADAERRALNWGVRGETVYVSKGEIPGGRGRRKAASRPSSGTPIDPGAGEV